MRINNVQSNQSFGMALKINSKLYPEIEKSGLSHIANLEKLGNDVKDVKLYDVCIEKDAHDLKIKSTKTNDDTDYLKNFRHEESQLGKWHEFTCVSAGCEDTYGGYNPNEPQIFRTLYGKAAMEEYKKFRNLNKYEQVAELSKLLEKKDIAQFEIKNAQLSKEKAKLSRERAEKLKIKTATNNLMAKYQVETEPEKKSIFRKILEKFS